MYFEMLNGAIGDLQINDLTSLPTICCFERDKSWVHRIFFFIFSHFLFLQPIECIFFLFLCDTDLEQYCTVKTVHCKMPNLWNLTYFQLVSYE